MDVGWEGGPGSHSAGLSCTKILSPAWGKPHREGTARTANGRVKDRTSPRHGVTGRVQLQHRAPPTGLYQHLSNQSASEPTLMKMQPLFPFNVTAIPALCSHHCLPSGSVGWEPRLVSLSDSLTYGLLCILKSICQEFRFLTHGGVQAF